MTPKLDLVIDTFLEAFRAEPAYVTMAPGRLEFLGNHTDYNGGRVLGVALDLGLYAAISEREDQRIALTTSFGDTDVHFLETDLDALTLFSEDDSRAWANYPLGVLKVILERGVSMSRGFNLAFRSDLPSGAGLSSSAAIELAALRAISILYDLDIDDPLEIARLGREAENEHVGVPCGIFDQGVSAYGKAGHAIMIDCKTEQFTSYALPANTFLWIFDTGTKYNNVESGYSERHRECIQARDTLQRTYSDIEQLCDVKFGQVEACEQDLSEVQFKRALHVTREHERVKQAEGLLLSSKAHALGQLLYESHESSRMLFENSTEELDFLVELLKKQTSVYGARLTGAGFGGAVFAWTTETFSQEESNVVVEAYKNKFGSKPNVYRVKAGEGARIL